MCDSNGENKCGNDYYFLLADDDFEFNNIKFLTVNVLIIIIV